MALFIRAPEWFGIALWCIGSLISILIRATLIILAVGIIGWWIMNRLASKYERGGQPTTYNSNIRLT